MEEHYKFELVNTLAATSNGTGIRLFEGLRVHVTPSVQPDPRLLYHLVKLGGGLAVRDCQPDEVTDEIVVVSAVQDRHLISRLSTEVLVVVF